MINLNKVIKVLIMSDFFLQAGWGLVGPIFAIFLTQQIKGGDLRMVGFVATCYWITKSFIQPFIAKFLDKEHGEKDDFIFLVTGMYVANLVPLGYIFSTQPWHIYTLEIIRGIAMACVIPTWSAIFTRHIDRGREAFSWSMQSTGIGIAIGISGAFGGLLASALGFKIIFLLVSIFGVFSSSVLLIARNRLFLKDHFAPLFPREKI